MKTKNYFPPTGILSVILIMLVMLGAGTKQHLKANQPNMPGITIDAPVALDATEITDISFTAKWTSVTGAFAYKLYVYRKVGTQWLVVDGYNGKTYTGISLNVSGLSPGNTYKYYVIAGSLTEVSDPSNEIQVTLIPAAPEANAATNKTHNSFTANWDSSNGATSYKLYVEMNFLGIMWTSVSGYEDGKVVSGTSHNVSQLLHMTEHRYWVKAVNANGESGNSNTINLLTKLTPTTTNAAYNISSSSFVANWNESVGATSYLLYVVRNSDEKNIIYGLEVEGTLYTVSGLSPGSGYHFAVRAKRDDQTSDLSNWTSVATAPDTPAAKAATNISSTSFQANWDAAAGATAYKLSVWKKSGLAWVPGYQEKTVTGTSEVISSLEPSTEYRYRLKAVTISSESGYSATIDVTTAPAPPVASAATSVTTNSFQSNWGAVNGATGYKLWVWSNENTGYSPEGYFPATLGNVTSHVLSNLESAHSYSYFVQTITANGTSIVSNTINVVTETNTINQYTLSLSVSPSGVGSVSGGGTFNEGTTVTAHASANAGFAFVNWTENGKVVSSSASYVFQISANRNLVANFEQIPATRYTIALTASPSNMGSVSGGGDYPQGTDVTVSATPASKAYRFVNWTEGKTIVSTDANYSFTVTADRNLVANFEQNAATTYTIAVTASPSNMGSTSGGGTYTEGTSVTVSATPASKMYHFVNWTEGKTIVSTDANYTFTATADRNLVANFEQNAATTYTIAVTASPSNMGSASGGGTYTEGASVTVSATPASKMYHFVNWTEGKTIVSTDANYTFTATADRNLVANFEQNAATTYTVDVAVLPASSGTVVGGGTFNEGSSITVTATPTEGFAFVNWTEGGTEVSTNAAYTFTLTANRSLVANFEELPPATFTIKASANPSKGGTTSIGTKTYTEGTTITISANANAGYHFVNWTEEGLEVSTSNNYSFTVTADRTLVANFEQDAAQTYTVALNVNGGEGGTVNFSSQSFEMGASVTAIATPADGYVFAKWMEGATQISTNAEYTFLVGGDITLTAYFDKKTASGLAGERNVRVYPNPAVATIAVTGIETGTCVKLIDLAGSTVIKQQATHNELNIDVSNLRRGCYYVVVEQNEIFDSRKVILK